MGYPIFQGLSLEPEEVVVITSLPGLKCVVEHNAWEKQFSCFPSPNSLAQFSPNTTIQ